jgi:putative Ig domain-containing protein
MARQVLCVRTLALILIPLLMMALLVGAGGSKAEGVSTIVSGISGSVSSLQPASVTSPAPITSSQANWFFGFFGELHFNTGVLPGDAAREHNTIFASEASITQSDASGNLLFYSDGKLVWNSLHERVNDKQNDKPNERLKGGNHPVQALSVPDPADPNPADPNSFYLISMVGYTIPSSPSSSPSPEGEFVFTKVSVSGSSVTLSSLNTPIDPPVGADKNIAEMVTAVPGCGTNYWIIVHGSFLEPDTNADFRHALFVYPLTVDGVGTPTVYPIVGSALFGQLKASPDGTRIAYGTGDSRSQKDGNPGFTHLLDFNRSTGVLSNPRAISRYAYGVSFSPNSQLLYLTESIRGVSGVEKIFQYDLSTADLNEKLVADVPATYSALQLGPDDRIYVALNENNHLAVINFPDERNTVSAPNACDYRFDGPSLNIPSTSPREAVSGFGLPNMIDARKPSVNFCPVITLSPAAGALPGAVVNTPYSQTFTTTGGIGASTFTVSSGSLPPGMILNSAGTLQGTPVAPGLYTFTVAAADANCCLGLREYQINVTCQTITLNPAAGALPEAVVNTPYSQTFTTTDGIGASTFTVSSGSLPPGLVLNSAGTLQGTPVAPGPFTFKIRAADTNGCTGESQYTILVICPVITLSPAAGVLPGAVVNTPYSQTLTATGGIGPYTFTVSSGSLPPGLVLNADGTLNGTPVAPGPYTFTVKAEDANLCPGFREYTITVTCQTITLNPAVSVLPGAVVNTPYSQTLTATGGIGASTFTVSGGSLPPGLVLNADGTLNGTPVAPGTYMFTITAADVNNCTGVGQYQIIVSCPVITLSPAAGALPGAVVNTPYSQTFTATGGIGPYAFTVSSGSLPPGLMLNSAGTLQGTPVTPGTYMFTITAADVNNCTGVGQYQIIVSCPVITLSPAAGALPGAVVNTPYSQTFTATGGCASSVFSVTSGALPPGLTLGSNGVLSGMATGPGDFTFTVTATDSCGCSQTQSYTLKVVQTRILVISAFRENGPKGARDEFVEIFNPSDAAVTVSTLPGNPGEDDVGVFSSAGKGTASDAITLRCLIPGATVIKGRGWFLCGGDVSEYSLSNLGVNGGTSHSVQDAAIIGDIPNDAGLVLLKFGTFPVTVSSAGFFSGGNAAVVFDSVGFGPYDSSAPASGQPSLSFKYCEGTCLQPVGDASTITSPACPATVGQAGAAFTVQSGGLVGSIPVCYGESGQYQIGRRRSVQQFVFNTGAGSLHRDTDNNADDFILLSPNPSSNVGQGITGRGGVTSVLGAAGPHSLKSPPVVGQGIYTGAAFDLGNANQLGPGNAERRYYPDLNILNANNNPLGTFLVRIRFTNNGNAAVSGVRFRIDDIAGLCGGQTGAYATGSGAGAPPLPPPTLLGATSETATQEARNIRPSTPNCQGEGSDNGLFTAVLKGVNHNAEFVSQPSDGTIFFVNGSSLEDVDTSAGLTSLSPLGGGGNNSYVINSNLSTSAVGDGVSGGPGSFAVAQPNLGSTSSSSRVLRVAFKFGVVKAGRFKLLLGREAFGPTPVN